MRTPWLPPRTTRSRRPAAAGSIEQRAETELALAGRAFRTLDCRGAAGEPPLTESCAALSESPHCPGLARHVAQSWLEAALRSPGLARGESLASHGSLERARVTLGYESVRWGCEVQTQVPVYGDRVGFVVLSCAFIQCLGPQAPKCAYG